MSRISKALLEFPVSWEMNDIEWCQVCGQETQSGIFMWEHLTVWCKGKKN